MLSYTKEEADILIAYYTPRMIGNLFSKANHQNALRVVTLFKEELENCAYRVCGRSNPVKGNATYIRCVDKIAMVQGLLSPGEILKKA